jgi:hypothetical protein
MVHVTEGPVSKTQRADALAITRHVVVLLRLTVGAGNRILYGEVVDPDKRSSHPFHGLAGLSAALRDSLAAVIAPRDDARDRESACDPGRPPNPEERVER